VPSRFLAEIPADVTEQIGARARRRAPDRGAQRYDYSYAQDEPGDVGLARGMRVRHPHFGTGVVISVAGSGANQKLKIQFERAGVKTLLLELARERYAVITSSSYFEMTNGLASVVRARENLVEALFQLNAARVNFARATGSLNALE